MRTLARLLVLACAGCAGLVPAWASAADASLAPSPALSCLSPAAAERTPVLYPSESFERKEGGTVSVELVFTAPDRAPRVSVTNFQPSRELVEAVFNHIAQFRVPCMAPGGPPVTLRQDYVFNPANSRKVMASALTDDADKARAAKLACLTRAAGAAQKLEYPFWARARELQGKVLISLRAVSPDAPPQVRVLAASYDSMESAVVEFVSGIRVPCLTEPFEWTTVYTFRMQDGPRTVLQDLSLAALIRFSKPMPPAYFDFDQMGCPFDAQLIYGQPHLRNRVRELETHNPARQPLLDWLSNIKLKLADDVNTAVLGDSMTVSVPCGKLDV